MITLGNKRVRPAGMLGLSEDSQGLAIAHVQENKVLSHTYLRKSHGIEEALQEFINEQNLQNVLCNYVLAYDDYYYGLIDKPKVHVDDLTQAILWSAKDHLNYPLDEAVVTWFDVPETRSQDNQQLIYAVIVNQSILHEATSLTKQAKLNLQYIDIKEMCLRNLVLLQKNSAGRIVVQINNNTIYIMFVAQGLIFLTRKVEVPQIDFNNKKSIDRAILELQRSCDHASSLFKKTNFRNFVILPSDIDEYKFSSAIEEQLESTANYMELGDFMQITDGTENACQISLAMGAALRDVTAD